MTDTTNTASKNTYKLTRLLRDGALMIALLVGFILLQTQVKKQFNPLYQEGGSFTEQKGDLASLYKVNSLGQIQNDPGAIHTEGPIFRTADDFDKIEPAAGSD
ncbi:MAG: hypothetical protein EP349_02990 [Alphaproteobacteria bacterium]|nr:MAG: hypothetical protein EP349_02990 [Alphaproteobacteria bacterium]